MAKLLLGKEVNASINEEIKAKVETLKAQNITKEAQQNAVRHWE